MLEIRPITFKAAKEYVKAYHRHLKPPVGHKFSISVVSDGKLVGVIMAGRPVARGLDDGLTLEVNRCCTDGHRNACSMLYGAAWRAAKAMGYRRMFTYTLEHEGGASLRASGWKIDWKTKGREWSTPSRPRDPVEQPGDKVRWVITN